MVACACSQSSGSKAALLFILILYVIAYPLSQARAEDDVDRFELSPEQLFDATVISVSKTSEKLMDAPAAVFVLTNEDIIRSGATSIPEALRMVPGVQVARANGGSWAVSVRGFNGGLDDKLLVLVDGRAVYDPLFAGVYWDVQDTVLEDIDRIEVVRGPGASLWGANAVNGVINIITKKAEDTQGFLSSTTVGNQDRGIVEERYGGTFGESGHYRVYGKYLNRDSEQTLRHTDANDEQEEQRAGFRADWKGQDAKDDFTMQGDVYRNNDGQLRIMPHFNTSATTVDQEALLSRGGNILGRWTRTFSDDSHFTLQSYAEGSSRSQLLINDQRATFDVDAQYELPAEGRHKIVFGGGYRYSNDDLTATPLVTFANIGENTQVFSSFVQDKITLVPENLFLTLGSKFEHNDFTGFEAEPNARLQWRMDEQQMMWASVARAVRTPSRLEEDVHLVQATAPGASLDSLPNTGLRSEKLYAYELGHRRQWSPDISSDIAVFYNRYNGLSTFTSQGFLAGTNPSRVIIAIAPTNTTNASVWGGETMANWRALSDLNFSASYSFLSMNLHGPTSGAEIADQQSPRHQINGRAQWDITQDVSFDAMTYYTSDVPGFAAPSHIRLDLRLGWRIIDGLQFSLVGQDLLNPRRHETGLPTDPHVLATSIERSVYGNFTWRF